MSAAYQRGANLATRLASLGLSSCLRSQVVPCATTSGSVGQIFSCGDDQFRQIDTACTSRAGTLLVLLLLIDLLGNTTLSKSEHDKFREKEDQEYPGDFFSGSGSPET